MNLLFIAFYIIAKLSWYNPALCNELPINCFNPDRWWHMSSGADARKHYWHARACPMEYPIGTQFVIEGSWRNLSDGTWTCLDRGGAVIVKPNGVVVLDLLTDAPVWADTLLVRVVHKTH